MEHALVAGETDEEILALARAASGVLDPSLKYLGLIVSPAAVDETLAWGTERPHVRPLRPPFGEDDLSEDGTELPLEPDGDSANAILGAAHSLRVTVIVTALRSNGWIERVFNRSATHDLLRDADLPVLVLPNRIEASDS